MAATAAAMMTVLAHPSTFSQPATTKGPMILGSAAISIIIAITGTATTPLITALQNSALIGSMRREVQAHADQRRDRDRGIERLGLHGLARQARPASRASPIA